MAIILPHIGLIIKCQGEIFILKIHAAQDIQQMNCCPKNRDAGAECCLTELIMTAGKCIIEKTRKGGTWDGDIDRAV